MIIQKEAPRASEPQRGDPKEVAAHQSLTRSQKIRNLSPARYFVLCRKSLPSSPDMLELGRIWRVGALAVALLPVAAEGEERPQAASAILVSVELADSTNLAPEVMTLLRNEVEEIYSTAGVGILWLREGSIEKPPHMARVYVLEELPALLETRLRAFRGKKTMALLMGREARASGSVIYISRTAVCRNATGGVPEALSPEALARALGRVVAHELAHHFISPEHTGGILKADLLPSELTERTFRTTFTVEQVRRLRQVARPEERRHLPCP